MSWREIWGNRSLSGFGNSLLESRDDMLRVLAKMNGYDSPTGSATWADLRDFISSSLLPRIYTYKSFFEVGCGSGLVSYIMKALLEKHTHDNVGGGGGRSPVFGGLDYSSRLVYAANLVFCRDAIFSYINSVGSMRSVGPMRLEHSNIARMRANLCKKLFDKCSCGHSDFVFQDAIDMDVSVRFDLVFSNGVFHYFESLRYAEVVLLKMLKKAQKAVFVLDLPDMDLRDKDMESKRHRGVSENAYSGKTSHLYFSRQWVTDVLCRYEQESGRRLSVEMERQSIPGYVNSQYRFNVFVTKS